MPKDKDEDFSEAGRASVQERRINVRGRGPGRKKAFVLGFVFNLTKTYVLLQLKERAWQRGMWNGIGGKIEVGEDATEAMSREFHEEVVTSVDIGLLSWRPGPILDFRNSDVEVHVFYTTFVDRIFPRLRSNTDEHVCVVSTDHLPERLVPHVAWLVPYLIECNDQVITIPCE